MNLLKKEDKWMTAREIEKELNIEYGSIISNLKRLFSNEDIIRQKKFINKNWTYIWRIKWVDLRLKKN